MVRTCEFVLASGLLGNSTHKNISRLSETFSIVFNLPLKCGMSHWLFLSIIIYYKNHKVGIKQKVLEPQNAFIYVPVIFVLTLTTLTGKVRKLRMSNSSED